MGFRQRAGAVEPSKTSHEAGEDYFYEALPFVETHPEHLFALGILFGVRERLPAQFRVLEIGTATGGNILPMAARYPESWFVGIDRAESSLSVARKVAQRAELGNVDLQLTDLRDFEDEPSSFDLIVCHGVYSWIPEEARAALRRIVRRHLAPQGMAYISFNTLPGWHLRGALRDMLRREVRGIESQAERVSKARAFLEFLGTNFPSDDSSRHWLLNELEILRQMSRDYLLGEHLVEYNRAEYFEDFARDIAEDGLEFVTDAHVPLVFPDRLGEEVASTIRARSRGVVQIQQALDHLELRCFRRAVMCRDDAALQRHVSASRIELLTVASHLEPESAEPDLAEGVEVGFKGRTGVIATDQAFLKAALIALAGVGARGMTFDRLTFEIARRLGRDELGADERARGARNLLGLYTKGAIELLAAERPVALSISERPRVFSFARRQASDGLPFCTSLRHEAIQTDSFDRAFLSRLDGRSTVAEAVSWVLDRARAGIVSVQMEGRECLDPRVFDEIAEQKLELYMRRGLLRA